MEQLKVRANKTQVQQVILNLLMNAMDAMSEQTTQRTLNIGIVRAEDNALVSIHDNGVGIAEDMLERVFDGFYTTKPKGMGVGLEVCRSIVELHGGKIWAKINPSGRGVIFYFTLPLTL
jgi:signal transduction histidine kinase